MKKIIKILGIAVVLAILSFSTGCSEEEEKEQVVPFNFDNFESGLEQTIMNNENVRVFFQKDTLQNGRIYKEEKYVWHFGYLHPEDTISIVFIKSSNIHPKYGCMDCEIFKSTFMPPRRNGETISWEKAISAMIECKGGKGIPSKGLTNPPVVTYYWRDWNVVYNELLGHIKIMYTNDKDEHIIDYAPL